MVKLPRKMEASMGRRPGHYIIPPKAFLLVLTVGQYMDWYTFFLLGNLMADTAIAIFAYEVSIFNPHLDKLKKRVRYLQTLSELIRSVPIVSITRAPVGEVKQDSMKLDDRFILELDENLFGEDKNILMHPPATYEKALTPIERIKFVIGLNQDKLPGLIDKANNEYNNKLYGYANKYLYNNIMYLFILGIILQLGSWLFGLFDP
jgi:hypothetical protein